MMIEVSVLVCQCNYCNQSLLVHPQGESRSWGMILTGMFALPANFTAYQECGLIQENVSNGILTKRLHTLYSSEFPSIVHPCRQWHEQWRHCRISPGKPGMSSGMSGRGPTRLGQHRGSRINQKVMHVNTRVLLRLLLY